MRTEIARPKSASEAVQAELDATRTFHSVWNESTCLTIGLRDNPTAKPARFPPCLVRYTAGTVSFTLFVSLLYIIASLTKYAPLVPLGTPYLNYAYWIHVPHLSFSSLSHSMRQCKFLSQGQVGRW
jgi:hypothetical protein